MAVFCYKCLTIRDDKYEPGMCSVCGKRRMKMFSFLNYLWMVACSGSMGYFYNTGEGFNNSVLYSLIGLGLGIGLRGFGFVRRIFKEWERRKVENKFLKEHRKKQREMSEKITKRQEAEAKKTEAKTMAKQKRKEREKEDAKLLSTLPAPWRIIYDEVEDLVEGRTKNGYKLEDYTGAAARRITSMVEGAIDQGCELPLISKDQVELFGNHIKYAVNWDKILAILFPHIEGVGSQNIQDVPKKINFPTKRVRKKANKESKDGRLFIT